MIKPSFGMDRIFEGIQIHKGLVASVLGACGAKMEASNRGACPYVLGSGSTGEARPEPIPVTELCAKSACKHSIRRCSDLTPEVYHMSTANLQVQQNGAQTLCNAN